MTTPPDPAPASPLPWECDTSSIVYVRGTDEIVFSAEYCANEKIDAQIHANTAYAVHAANALPALASRCAALERERGELVAMMRDLVMTIEQVDPKHEHAAFCNGVHSPDGQCEGTYLLSKLVEDASALLLRTEPAP